MVLRINLNKELRGLFFKWLERLEYERTHRVNSHVGYRPSPSYQPACLNFGNDDEIEGVIYFYEWSNARTAPRTFYTLKAFENFLDRCGIYVPSYQWELIRNIPNPYVACKKDCKELIIKINWDSLKSALEEDNSSSKGSEDREPYAVRITRPPMYAEVNNRYPDMEEVNSWFG